MHEVMIFGDIHNEEIPTKAVTHLLAELKELGYDRLFVESPLNNNFNYLMSSLDERIHDLELYPDGQVPDEGNLTTEQKADLAKYRCSRPEAIRQLNQCLAFDKELLACLKARRVLLPKAKAIGFTIVCIDVARPQEYSYAGGMDYRTNFMFNQVKQSLSNSDSSKSIIFSGFGHVIDCWENDAKHGLIYSHGFLKRFSDTENFTVTQCFIAHSADNKHKEKVSRDLAQCAPAIVEQVHIGYLTEDELEDLTLTALLDKCKITNENKQQTKKNTYRVLIQDNKQYGTPEQYANQKKIYLKDLGAENIRTITIGKYSFIEFELCTWLLDNTDRLNLLKLNRAAVPWRLHQIEWDNLQAIPGISIEYTSDNETKLTFNNNDFMSGWIKDILSTSEQQIMQARDQASVDAMRERYKQLQQHDTMTEDTNKTSNGPVCPAPPME